MPRALITPPYCTRTSRRAADDDELELEEPGYVAVEEAVVEVEFASVPFRRSAFLWTHLKNHVQREKKSNLR